MSFLKCLLDIIVPKKRKIEPGVIYRCKKCKHYHFEGDCKNLNYLVEATEQHS
jgi:hypothetical protein